MMRHCVIDRHMIPTATVYCASSSSYGGYGARFHRFQIGAATLVFLYCFGPTIKKYAKKLRSSSWDRVSQFIAYIVLPVTRT